MSKHELWLRDALADLMGVDPSEVSLTNSFAEQGLDSLVGLRLARKLQDALEIEIELEWLFDYPSIRELSQFLENHLGDVCTSGAQSDRANSACALTDSRE